jgi:HK97 family phage major capsid protein
MEKFIFTSKSNFQDFLTFKKVSEDDKKDADKMAGIYNEFNDGLRTAIADAEANKVSKDEVATLKAELQGAMKEQYIALQTILKEQGKALLSMNKGAEAQLDDLASILAEKKADLSKLKGSANASDNVKFTVKTVGDMSISGSTTGQIPQAYRKPGIGDVKERAIRLMDFVTVGSIGSNLKEWVYVANEEGAANVTAEGTLKNQIDFELLVGSAKVEKVTAFITVTDEMLEDVEGIQTLIQTKLATKINLKLEQQVYAGSGVSPQLTGISTVATTFAAGSFANTIDNPNNVDVLAVAQNQIEVANQTMPTAIFMHPTDVTKLLVEKVSSTDKRYIERLQMIAGTLSFDGIPVIKTTLITEGNFLMGDFTKAAVDFKKGVTIEIGYNSDNFVKNYKTIRAELRAVCSVEHNDRTAFVKGVFATAKAALATT